jgi:hypothetical protein
VTGPELRKSNSADIVVLDPFNGDPDETSCPGAAWQALAAMVERWTE